MPLLTAPSCSVNASAATCDVGPNSGSGSPRWKNGESLTFRPFSRPAASRSAGDVMRASSAVASAVARSCACCHLSCSADLVLHLGERALAGGTLLEHLDHVEAEVGLDEIRRLARRHRERGVLERLDHRAAAEEPEVAAAALAGLVLRVLAGQGREVGARRLRFLEDRLGLLAHRGRVLVGRLEQDVLRVHLLRVGELLQVGLVVGLDLLRRRGDRGAQRLRVDGEVADLAALAELVARRILRVERLRLGVGGGEAGAELVGREADDVELHLLVAAAVLGVGLLLGDGDPARDRLLELLRQQVGADAVLEVVFAQRRPLRAQHGAVAVGADELAVLAEGGDVPDELDHLGVGDAAARGASLRLRSPCGRSAASAPGCRTRAASASRAAGCCRPAPGTSAGAGSARAGTRRR